MKQIKFLITRISTTQKKITGLENILTQRKKYQAHKKALRYLNQKLNLNEDKKTGFVTISIKHQSPYIAKQWTELIVNEINKFYRQKDKLESEKAARYLNQQQ